MYAPTQRRPPSRQHPALLLRLKPCAADFAAWGPDSPSTAKSRTLYLHFFVRRPEKPFPPRQAFSSFPRVLLSHGLKLTSWNVYALRAPLQGAARICGPAGNAGHSFVAEDLSAGDAICFTFALIGTYPLIHIHRYPFFPLRDWNLTSEYSTVFYSRNAEEFQTVLVIEDVYRPYYGIYRIFNRKRE